MLSPLSNELSITQGENEMDNIVFSGLFWVSVATTLVYLAVLTTDLIITLRACGFEYLERNQLARYLMSVFGPHCGLCLTACLALPIVGAFLAIGIAFDSLYPGILSSFYWWSYICNILLATCCQSLVIHCNVTGKMNWFTRFISKTQFYGTR